MNSAVKYFIIFTFVSLIYGQFNPIEIMPAFNDNTLVLCAGAQFNATSVVVPASCIGGNDLNTLGVRRRIPTPSGHRASTTQSHGGSVHPNFASLEQAINNIGIIQYTSFNQEFLQQFPSRNLSDIPDRPSLCLLTGWLRRTPAEQLLTDTVQVLPPSQCGSTNPHIHCSIFPSINHQTCRFIRGTPLNCDNSTIAGMVLSENGCELRFIEVNGVRTQVVMLRYTSMSLFEEWKNSGSYLKSSIILLTIGLFSSVMNSLK